MERKAEDKVPVSKQAVFRVGLALMTVVALFLLARQMFIPAAFGEYGRYRGDSIAENVSQEARYASSGDICAGCHKNITQVVSGADHRQMDCQTCHGPAAKHTENPGAVQPKIQQPAELCKTCHTATAGRTQQLATVKPQEHSKGMDCTQCHDPHSPWAKIRG